MQIEINQDDEVVVSKPLFDDLEEWKSSETENEQEEYVESDDDMSLSNIMNFATP